MITFKLNYFKFWGEYFLNTLGLSRAVLFFLNLGHINCVRISIIELAVKQIVPQSQKWKFWIGAVNSCVTHALTPEPKVMVPHADKRND